MKKGDILDKNKKLKRKFEFLSIIYVLAIILLLIIIRPFIYSLILGIILGVFFFPINRFLRNKGLKPNIASLLLVITIVIIMVIFTYLFVDSVIKSASEINENITNFEFEEIDILLESTVGINVSTENLTLPIIESINSTLSSDVPSLVNSLTDIILGIFIMLFVLYYLFKDGEDIIRIIMNMIPASEKQKEHIKAESQKILYGVMYGQLLIAILQGILGGLAFFIFGLNNPVFWGFIMAVFAFIPIVGTPTVWVPAAIIQIINGNIFSGVGLLIFGTVILLTIDNFIKPKLISRQSGLHPILVILSIFGGVKVFGVIGLLIGPMAVAICVLIIRLFNREVVMTELDEGRKVKRKRKKFSLFSK